MSDISNKTVKQKSPSFTPSQLNAMSIKDRTVLVSAAAGSGKTFTLTKRIINKIIGDENGGADLSRILVVTFTRAAAAELKAKISKALADAVAEHPENTRLQSQLVMLGSAKISTIDSFFVDPVRSNFEKLGLSSNMRLADDGELEELRQEVFTSVLDEFYDKYRVCTDLSLADPAMTDPFTSLLCTMTSARDSSDLIPTLFGLYQKIITAPEGVARLSEFADRMRKEAELDFFCTTEGAILKEHINSMFRHDLTLLEPLTEPLSRDPVLCKNYLPAVESDISRFKLLMSALDEGYGAIHELYPTLVKTSLKGARGTFDVELAERVKNTREAVNPPTDKNLKKYLSRTPDEIRSSYLESADITEVIYELLSLFDKKYSSEKIQRGLFEFSDMPRFLLKLLQNEDGTPSDTALAMSENFDEIYIDEYQDVNEIQDKIFELLGGSRRFMVGDIKQSIYRFRNAEPSLFSSYRRIFPIYDKENDTPDAIGSTVFMSNNFRCDENIIKMANQVCSYLFKTCNDSIGYTPDDDLVFSKALPYEGYVSPKVNLCIVEESADDEDNRDIEDDGNDEAIICANEIAELLRNGISADGSKIQPSDIAVLVKSESKALPLADALRSLNIKYSLASKTDLFDEEDMNILVDLLEVIDNPRSDVPLCALLTSPIGQKKPLFTLEEIITARRSFSPSLSLFDAIVSYGKDFDSDPLATPLAARCHAFTTLIENLRRLSRRLSADKLLRVVIAIPEFEGLSDTSAYTYLYDCACKYSANSWNGLSSFVSYYKNHIAGDNQTSAVKEGGDAVRIMTIHKSKGLEFKVCFVYDCARGFNLSDGKNSVVFDRKISLAMKLPRRVISEKNAVPKIRRENTAIREALCLGINQKQIEEEMRVLYVALTRARERLYISATLKSCFADFKAKLEALGSSDYAIKSMNNYISWIISSLFSENDRQERDFYTLNLYKKGVEKLCAPLPHSIGGEIDSDADESLRAYAEIMSYPDKMSESERLLASIPSRVAASKVYENMLDETVFLPRGPLTEDMGDRVNDGTDAETVNSLSARIELMRSQSDDFDTLILRGEEKPTASERGSATHLFLQYCDFENLAKDGIDAEALRLVREKFMSEHSAEIMNRKQLERFVKTPLFGRITNAARVEREFRFGLFVNAREFTTSDELYDMLGDRKIYVQGSVDLLIINPDGSIHVCDYKTDRVSDEEFADRDLLRENMMKKYKNQLRQYRRAIQLIFGKAPEKTYIFSLAIGEMIEMDV